MVITFMIGNGFDLACGLKSSYKDVYEGYVKTQSKSELIAKFKKDLDENWENWADFEMGMAEYAQNFNNEAELIECVMDFRAFMMMHLRNEERHFLKKFASLQRKHGVEIADFVNEGFLTFYLGGIKPLYSVYEKAKFQGPIIYRALNFNYTKTLNAVILAINNLYDVINIHGTLEEKNVAVGVDCINQMRIKFELSSKGKRTFVKPCFNDEYDPKKVENAIRMIHNSTWICVFGLSLGDSDLTWRNEIVDWLRSDREHQLFVFDIDCCKKRTDDKLEIMNIEDDYREQYAQKLGISSEESKMQIHIPVGNTFVEFYGFLDDIEKADKLIA